MPDEIVVPDWLIDLYDATVGWVLGFIPDIDLGGFVIPDWFVLLFIVGLISGWGQNIQRRREREELARLIAAAQNERPPLPK